MEIPIPAGCFTGSAFFAEVDGRDFKVIVPEGAKPGDDIIMDLLSDQPEVQVDRIYLNAPEGDDSDGYDDSDTEEGQADFLSRNLLKVSFKNLNKFFFVLCIFIYKLPTYFFYFFLQTTVAEVVTLGIEQLNLEGYDDMEAVDIMDIRVDRFSFFYEF